MIVVTDEWLHDHVAHIDNCLLQTNGFVMSEQSASVVVTASSGGGQSSTVSTLSTATSATALPISITTTTTSTSSSSSAAEVSAAVLAPTLASPSSSLLATIAERSSDENNSLDTGNGIGTTPSLTATLAMAREIGQQQQQGSNVATVTHGGGGSGGNGGHVLSSEEISSQLQLIIGNGFCGIIPNSDSDGSGGSSSSSSSCSSNNSNSGGVSGGGGGRAGNGGYKNSPAKALLICRPNSHHFQSRSLLLEPGQQIKVGRSVARSRVADNNAIFDCKVLSRNHALLWYIDGKFFIKDTNSSNGTFINNFRLSQTCTESEPYEVSSGDIVQFGVDVMENTRKETHGCIVATLKLYLPDGRETKASQSTCVASNIPPEDLYRLNKYIQEAVQREQTLEKKLTNLQKIIEMVRTNSSGSWQALIDEDRLLSRIDILEKKLQCFQKNITDDKLREEVIKLQDDKMLYQNSAKEALRKVYQERMDAIHKLSTIERALVSSEDECSILREQLQKTQDSLLEVSSSLSTMQLKCDELIEKCSQCELHEKQLDLEIKCLCNEIQIETSLNTATKKELSSLRDDNQLLKKRLSVVEKHLPFYNDDNNSDEYRKNNKNDLCDKRSLMRLFANSDLHKEAGSEDIIIAMCNDGNSNDELNNIETNYSKIYDKLLEIESNFSILESTNKHNLVNHSQLAITAMNVVPLTMIVDDNLTDAQNTIESTTAISTVTTTTTSATTTTPGTGAEIFDGLAQNDKDDNGGNDNDANDDDDDDDDDEDEDEDDEDDDGNRNGNETAPSILHNEREKQNLIRTTIMELKQIYSDLMQQLQASIEHSTIQDDISVEKIQELDSKFMSSQLELQTLRIELQARPTYNQFQEKIKYQQTLETDLTETKRECDELRVQLLKADTERQRIETDLLNAKNNLNAKSTINVEPPQTPQQTPQSPQSQPQLPSTNLLHIISNTNMNVEASAHTTNHITNKTASDNDITTAIVASRKTDEIVNAPCDSNNSTENDCTTTEQCQIRSEIEMINDPCVEREEEFILFKERYATVCEENQMLKDELRRLKRNFDQIKNVSLVKLMFLFAPFIAIIGYLLVAPYL